MLKFIDGAITLFCMLLLSKSIHGDTKYIPIRTCIMQIISIVLFGVILLGEVSYKIAICSITLGAFIITWCVFQYIL